MIGMVPLVERIANVIASDTEIASYCTDHFGAALRVYIGVNPKTPPTRAECPFAVVQPVRAEEGYEVSSYRYTVNIDVAIDSDASTSSGGIVTLTGISIVDGLWRLVRDAIESHITEIQASSWTYSIDALELFPMIISGAEIVFNVPAVIGGEITVS